MKRPRIIPILCLNSEKELISTVSFRESDYIGDPLNAISVYNEFDVDELGVIDIYASREGRSFDTELLRGISEECKTPLFAGGGISSLDDIEQLLKNGAEKVLLSSKIIESPDFLQEATNQFGTSSIIVCLDCIPTSFNQFNIYNSKTKLVTEYEVNAFIKHLQNFGLGECIVQSIAKDGHMNGYDQQLISTALDGTCIPIIALGGCSSITEISVMAKSFDLSAYASGSIFSFYNSDREVLINYPNLNFLNTLIQK